MRPTFAQTRKDGAPAAGMTFHKEQRCKAGPPGGFRYPIAVAIVGDHLIPYSATFVGEPDVCDDNRRLQQE